MCLFHAENKCLPEILDSPTIQSLLSLNKEVFLCSYNLAEHNISDKLNNLK